MSSQRRQHAIGSVDFLSGYNFGAMTSEPVEASKKVAVAPPRREQHVRPPDLIYGLEDRPPLAHLVLLGAQHVAVICPYLVFVTLIAKTAGTSTAVTSHAVGLGMIAIALATLLQAHRLGPVGSGYLAPPVVSAIYLSVCLVAAAKAVVLNLISVGAAFGALVLVFQEGHGCRFLGVPEGTAGVFPIVPILAFAIVFGLSMDYEVFLVARVLEARRSGLGENEAIAEALAKTAGLITSAAAIMIVVFTGFTLGDFLVIKMLGFTLAVAVLIDATLVRMVIGPALLTLAGDWNWWPLGLYGAPATSEKELVP